MGRNASIISLPEELNSKVNSIAPKHNDRDQNHFELSIKITVIIAIVEFIEASYIMMKQKNKIAILIMLALTLLFCCKNSYSQSKHSLLSRIYPSSRLNNILNPRHDFHPFPTWQDRESWKALPGEVRQELISRGERYLNFQWPALPATLFLEFARTGNRENFQKLRSARREALCSLVLAECVEGSRRFMDDIVNGIWMICEETYWGVPAHIGMQAKGIGLPDISEPTVDLFAGETGSLLAWTSYLLGDQLDEVSPLIQQRIQLELERKILIPCLERDDFWWMGFEPGVVVNNWNPWVNSNWLTVVLLNEKDEPKRIAAIEKILRSLDVFIDSYPPDGGCDEGPGYWNRAAASLFDCLELMYSATDGAINIYNEPLIQEMGRYIYRAHIADRYFINFADASAKVTLEADLTYRYGKRIGDEKLASFGAYMVSLQRQGGVPFQGSIGRQLPGILNFTEIMNAKKAQPLLRDIWMEGSQVMAARSQAGSEKGFYVAAKGGHNAESHNHNDIGNFIVYLDGQPMIIDVGVETYTRKTFSTQRYDIWTMQSAYHNLPTIDGVMQKEGRKFVAREVVYTSDDSFAQLRLDIAGAYPPAAGINQWVRTIRLNRGENILVTDAFDLNKEAQEIALSLMTACEVSLDESGKIILQRVSEESGNTLALLNLFYNVEKLTAKLENLPIEDNLLKSVWGDRITRILLRSKNPTMRDSWMLRIVP